MTRWMLVGVALAGVVPLAHLRAAQGPPSSRRVPAAVIIRPVRHDRSPALRNIPPAPVAVGAPSEREPASIRRILRQRTFALDPVAQSAPLVPLMPTPTRSFEGVSNVNGVLPPDVNGDVGPNHYVQWVNLSFAIYTKGSASSPPTLLYGPAAGNTLWSGFGGPCETRNDGDVIVRYDHLADRWVMSQLAIPNSVLGIVLGPFYQCIAVSATPDPLGEYYRYQYSFDNLNDYPKFGVWPDAYYMTMNEYTSGSLQFAGQGVVAFDREKMLAGLPAPLVFFDLGAVDINLGGMLPADLDGPPPPAGSPDYFVQVDDDAWGYAAQDELQLWRFHVDWSNPSASSFTGPTLLPTAPFDSNMCGYSHNCIPQPGTTARLDALADRLMYRLQYRNFGDHESLVVNHTVDVDGTDHAGIRWYEIRNPGTNPQIYQQGTFAPDADNRWMASAAMDNAGNIAVGFSVSGAATFPSIRYAGRLATDPPGTLAQGEADLMIGAGAQLHASGRWGDYSQLDVDPVDDCTFWYTQEYYGATSQSGWQTRVGTFAFPTCQSNSGSSLPVVTVTASTPTATEAGPVAGAVTLSRTGDTSAPLTVTYSTGGTATPGADYIALPGTATIAAGASSTTLAVTPIDDLAVEPDETVVVSITPDPAYLVGSAGATVTIVSDDLPSDLAVSSLSTPLIAGAGQSIVISDTTVNKGAGPSEASVTGFYLSSNLTLEASDANLGSRDVPPLAVGASSSATTTVTIPAGTPTGSYFVLAMADATRLVTESQENNNAAFHALRVGPDLVVSSVTVPSSAAAGGTITVSDTTANTGGGSADASTTSFYLSSNPSFDTADVSLGSRAVPSLAPGAVSTASTTLTLPGATATGLYYVIARADSGSVVVETSEINNARPSASIRVGPDLVETAVTAPSTAGAGSAIVVSDTASNAGAGQASASTTAFYLSSNSLLDGTDVQLGTRPVPPLAAGASNSGLTTLTIPAGTATGYYYVLAKADANDQVVESIETNNVRSSFIVRIGPDLIVSGLMLTPNKSAPGGTIAVTDSTKNSGGGAAGPSTTRFYLSTNLALDASDVPLGSRAVGPIAPGGVSTATTTIAIPAGTAAGTYYVIAAADADNAVVETAETDNTRLAYLQIVVP
ncbi:MAG: CARDB domain-containing protein [Betaproteobacteria bacterium]